MNMFPVVRPRRLRASAKLRRMVAETRLHPAMFVLPLFVVPGEDIANPIRSMPGNYQLSIDRLIPVVAEAAAAGVGGVILFGIPAEKDEEGTGAWDPFGPVPEAIRAIKESGLAITVWADVCMCEYTSHGHCGVLRGEIVDNDATLPLLARAAVAYADAGADVIAPSDMMDGRVAAIRGALDEAGYTDLALCSYSAKYASGYYGPFRDAAESAPAFGDRNTHQMDPNNVREALVEVEQDLAEGADMVMVKPGMPYLDIVRRVKDEFRVPTFAYQVSGEYAMHMAAIGNGWLSESVIRESLICLKRAGADGVLTYFAFRLAKELAKE